MLIPLQDRRQTLSYNCGPALCLSLGRYFGVGPQNESGWAKLLKTTVQDGTSRTAILDAFLVLGVPAHAKTLTIPDLIYYTGLRRPVVCAVTIPGDDISHWVACVGFMTAQELVVQDPVRGRTHYDTDKFDTMWHDESASHFGIILG